MSEREALEGILNAPDADANKKANARQRLRELTKKEKQDKDDEIRKRRLDLKQRELDLKKSAQDQGEKRLAAGEKETDRKAARRVISDREKRRNKKDAAENKKRARIRELIVKRKEKEERFKGIAKQSLSPKIDQIDDRDGTATAMQKFGSNLGRSVGGAAKGAVYGSGYLLKRSQRKRAEKDLQRHDDLQNRRKRIRDKEDMYGKKRDEKIASKIADRNAKRDAKSSALTISDRNAKRSATRSADANTQKRGLERPALPAAKQPALPAAKQPALPGGRTQKALPPGRSQKSLPAARSPKALPAARETSGRLARRDPEEKKRMIKARGGSVTEQILYEVEKMKKDKIKKVIDIMRGKNEVEVNPGMKESINWKDDYKPLEIETVDLIKPEPLKASNWRQEISEEDNVKKVTSINKNKRMDAKMQAFKDMKDEPYETNPKKRKDHAEKLLDRLMKVDEGAAWTKKEGKSKSGGLNEKGRKSYERENPGSDLKAPSKKVGNPRRKSFCARMKGMKKKLTSSKTANDPNSRINKSLRAWNC